MTIISSIIYSIFIIIVLLFLRSFIKIILPTLTKKGSTLHIKMFGIEIKVTQ